MNQVIEELFGKDPRVLKAVSEAKEMANYEDPLLITGETGVGKESLGHYIHLSSERRNFPCLVVECSKNEKDVENEILGHRDPETGKFHRGVLEKANGGTIILRNIDSINENFQKKLHRIFLELPDYEINIRIIVCTTKNLSKLVGAGRFQRILYLYLAKKQVNLIPLRERKEDIHYFCDKFLTFESLDLEREKPFLHELAIDKLVNYYWTHNLIELISVVKNTLEDLPINKNQIDVDDLALGERRVLSQPFDFDDDGLKLMSLKDAERLLIRKALIHTSENRTQAAKILGVSIRTLRNKINEYRNDGSNYFVNLR